mmetsp:Transcript_20253/g.56993  ORF Transcript_20253/g.56993 Transcript_20253/m.56993 type:complete len:589 (-) Transcript_20253:74-1840(-)|eukprot:CAMPEP_0119120520 /NCGR_PEP_ID=MMETSP1310-20130426/1513_1 /TAXON_ID=464262 /ORGANISM="Genus nov. species nov., Strain RCC2339" /LENGTH=588 /DNA_ID=CAMNT_0007110001 /DNA_START=99 /DNA_END=1868 /DNA_ORIENTATION=-
MFEAVISIIGVVDAGTGASLPVKLMSLVLLAITTIFLTVSYPPTYLKKKYEEYKLAQGVLKGGDHRNLTLLQLAVRMVKHDQNLPIERDETFVDSNVDLCKYIMGTEDMAQVDKYWTYAPGLTFEQKRDGVSVRVKGDDFDSKLMSSLSYWGFHVNQEVLDYAVQKAQEVGVGNHGSYLLLGKNTVVEEAYERLATFFKRKYCAISASGFLACMNLVSYLAPKGGVIFMDEKAHICLRYGSKISGAKTVRFPHNNYDALETLVQEHRHKYTGRAILVLDGIYSADGTIANLPRAREICDKYDIALVMDEAHSLGSMGVTGHGIEEHFGMYGACDYICGVFSKSLSSYGGFVVSNRQEVIDLNVSPGVGFATGPHAFSAATVSKGIEIIERDGAVVRPQMEQLRWYFMGQLYRAGSANILGIGMDLFVSFPHSVAATAVAISMRRRGERGLSAWLISSFIYPSVPLGRSILRITINPLITRDIIDDFCLALHETLNELSTERFDEYTMLGEYDMPAHQMETKYVGDLAEFNSKEALLKVKELRLEGTMVEPELSHTAEQYRKSAPSPSVARKILVEAAPTASLTELVAA